jgi:hypothetical protein
MGMRGRVAGLILGALYSGTGYTQAQPDARISVSQGTISAGDSLAVNLTDLDFPSPCDSRIVVQFGNLATGRGFTAVGSIEKGGTSSTLRAHLPLDFEAGVFASQQGGLNPCPGYSQVRNFAVPRITVTVKAIPDSNRYPTSAKIELSLTQKQFLSSKSSELGDLNTELYTYTTQNPANTPQLRKYLAGIVSAAEDALGATEKQYAQEMGSKGPLPAFFADFHAQYQGLRSDLLGEPPMEQPTASAEGGASFVYIQLQTKRSGLRLLDKVPADAIAVHNVIGDNQAAYQLVAANGEAIFHARLTTVPTGARIRYKKLIDDEYEDYSKPTDVPDATFELATTLFVFHMDGCNDDGPVRINPYEDTQPDIVGKLHCK